MKNALQSSNEFQTLGLFYENYWII